jgi:hypothetical protein
LPTDSSSSPSIVLDSSVNQMGPINTGVPGPLVHSSLVT